MPKLAESEKRRVAIFCPTLLPRSATFIQRQAMAYRNYVPQFVGMRLEGDFANSNLPHTVIASRFKRNYLAEYIFMQTGISPFFKNKIRAQRPALIHGHFGESLPDILNLANALKIPSVITFHGRDATIDDDCAGPSIRWRRFLRNRPAYLQKVHSVIAVSDFIKAALLRLGADENKVVVIRNGIAAEDIKTGGFPRTRKIVAVGRLVEKKGFIFLIEALSYLKQTSIGEIKLVIIGDGPLRAELEQAARRYNVDVTFAGFKDPSYVLREMSEATAVVVPSVTASNGDSEGLPTVILEAQACATPLVVTRHAGNLEAVVQNQSALVVDEKSATQLAEAINELCSKPEMVEFFGVQGRRHVLAHFSQRGTIEAIETLYERLITLNVASRA